MNYLSNKILIRLPLSVLVSASIVLSIILFADKYTISLLELNDSDSKSHYYYFDLDMDGNSEKLIYQKNNGGRVSLLVYKNNKIVDHWNFKGKWGRLTTPLIGDINDDSNSEVFIFTQVNDSIYMHCIDPVNNRIVFQYRFIAMVKQANGKYDYSILPGEFFDEDGDGIREVYFTINTGYSISPRNIFAYNFVKDTVFRSPDSCAPLFSPKSFDLDDDSIPEFFASTVAVGNCDSSNVFTDHFSWLMIFKPDLNFKQNPISFKAYPSNTQIEIICGIKNYIFVIHIYNGIKNYESFVALIGSNGTIYKRKNIKLKPDILSVKLVKDPKNRSLLYLLANTGKVFKIQNDLNMKEHLTLPELNLYPTYSSFQLDLTGDGIKEQILLAKSKNQIIITEHNFKNPVKYSFDKEIIDPLFSLKQRKNKNPKLLMDTTQETYLLEYKKNFFYKYWYYVFTVSILIVYIKFILISKIMEYRRLKISETQKKITELQLKSFQNNIDPHFTFNIIESFGNLIEEQDKDKASFIFNNYTRILKSVIINSEKVFISLQEEFDFIKSYLDLERYRLNNKFDYRINIANGIDLDFVIPKMVIHIFVENAVKHGVKHMSTGGLIQITTFSENRTININIEDNGIGRERAKQLGMFSTGKGLKIVEEIFVLYKKLKQIAIKYEVVDLTDNREASGTLVNIKIPQKKH